MTKGEILISSVAGKTFITENQLFNILVHFMYLLIIIHTLKGY